MTENTFAGRSPEELLDDEYAIVEAIDIGVTLATQLHHGGPLRAILERAREDSVAAVHALIWETDPDKIREFQWGAQRYQNLCRWMKQIIGDSKLQADMMRGSREEFLAVAAGLVAEEDPEIGD